MTQRFETAQVENGNNCVASPPEYIPGHEEVEWMWTSDGKQDGMNVVSVTIFLKLKNSTGGDVSQALNIVISTWGPGDGGLSRFTLFSGQDQGMLFWNFRACI